MRPGPQPHSWSLPPSGDRELRCTRRGRQPVKGDENLLARARQRGEVGNRRPVIQPLFTAPERDPHLVHRPARAGPPLHGAGQPIEHERADTRLRRTPQRSPERVLEQSRTRTTVQDGWHRVLPWKRPRRLPLLRAPHGASQDRATLMPRDAKRRISTSPRSCRDAAWRNAETGLSASADRSAAAKHVGPAHG